METGEYGLVFPPIFMAETQQDGHSVMAIGTCRLRIDIIDFLHTRFVAKNTCDDPFSSTRQVR